MNRPTCHCGKPCRSRGSLSNGDRKWDNRCGVCHDRKTRQNKGLAPRSAPGEWNTKQRIGKIERQLQSVTMKLAVAKIELGEVVKERTKIRLQVRKYYEKQKARANGGTKHQGKGNSYKKHKGDRCEECGFVAKYSAQLDVDHIDGNHDNNDVTNLQTLCATCHRAKTIEAGDHLTPRYDTDELPHHPKQDVLF